MRQILKDFHEKPTWKEKHSLAENLCEKVTASSEYQNAEIIFAYIPDTLEADCTPIILDALEKEKKVCVPKVDFEAMKQGQSKMDFYFLKDCLPLEDQLETGAYGIREPKAGLEKVVFKKDCRLKPDNDMPSPEDSLSFPCTDTGIFMLVPGVAFTKDGKRLGHGKGFYDIYIEEMRKSGLRPFLCGFALPCQIVEDLPTEEHDILMDKVIF